MNFSVSDLLFPTFNKAALRQLNPKYGIEFFYEFGKDCYWEEELEAWGKRKLSIHGPCVALNLADPNQNNFLEIYKEAFAYAQKCQAAFVVVHTNEAIIGQPELAKERILQRLKLLLLLAESYRVQVVIENVGLIPKENYLFQLEEFLAFFKELPKAKALLDVGHAQVNGWDLAQVVKELGSNLIALHLHDNDGSSDQHLPIGQGNIDWVVLFEAVKKYSPTATLVLEYCCGFSNTDELEKHINLIRDKYLK